MSAYRWTKSSNNKHTVEYLMLTLVVAGLTWGCSSLPLSITTRECHIVLLPREKIDIQSTVSTE